jgi:hypothetical protein
MLSNLGSLYAHRFYARGGINGPCDWLHWHSGQNEQLRGLPQETGGRLGRLDPCRCRGGLRLARPSEHLLRHRVLAHDLQALTNWRRSAKGTCVLSFNFGGKTDIDAAPLEGLWHEYSVAV